MTSEVMSDPVEVLRKLRKIAVVEPVADDELPYLAPVDAEAIDAVLDKLAQAERDLGSLAFSVECSVRLIDLAIHRAELLREAADDYAMLLRQIAVRKTTPGQLYARIVGLLQKHDGMGAAESILRRKAEGDR